MKDHIFISEFRKRILMIESEYEELGRRLNAARITLAMFEEASTNQSQTAENPNLTETVANVIVDVLSDKKEMHRAGILETIVLKGIHLGYSENKKKQLAAISTLLSKDARFKPVKGKSGYWTLTEIGLGLLDTLDDSSDTRRESGLLGLPSHSESERNVVKAFLPDRNTAIVNDDRLDGVYAGASLEWDDDQERDAD